MKELIKLAARGSRSAQEKLYLMLGEQMRDLCRFYLSDKMDVEDVIQEGFIKFFTALPSFTYRSDGETASWMRTIMKNLCLELLDYHKKTRSLPVEEAEGLGFQPEALSYMAVKEIHEMIEEVPKQYKQVFNLGAIHGLKHSEIAKDLKISEGTSYSNFSRAKEIIHKILHFNGYDLSRSKFYKKRY